MAGRASAYLADGLTWARKVARANPVAVGGDVMGKFGFSKPSFSRAIGLSTLKGKASRAIGVPLTQSGREKKFGRLGAKYLWPVGLLTAKGKRSTFEAGEAFDSAEEPRQSLLGSVFSAVFRLAALGAAGICFLLAWVLHSGSNETQGDLSLAVWFLAGMGLVALLVGIKRKRA